MNLGENLSEKKIGLVLSGGGVKGIAHVGLIKALLERNIKPDVVSGASAGAIVGALYANGVSPLEMLHFFKETPLLKYNFFSINKPGLFDTNKYLLFFEKFFQKDSFEALEKKLYIATTNLQKGEVHYFSEGDLLKTILASAALPPVFSPVEIKGELYADGGIVNNYPIEPLVGTTDYIIGSYVTQINTLDKNQLKSSFQLSQRATHLILHANVQEKLHIADLLFIPKNIETIGVLDKKAIEKAFNLGYEYAATLLDEKLKI